MPAVRSRSAVLVFCLLQALHAGAITVSAPRYPESYGSARAEFDLSGKPLLETPASTTVLPRALLDDQSARAAPAALANDASVGENYAPLGYYEAFSIRGFTLDNASGYKHDGLTIANESSQPLENKERVELLKGAAGFEAGLASPGGVVNYVLKRPSAGPVRRVVLDLRDRGTRYGHMDLGGRSGRFGYRLNAAREDYHPYVREAVGRREFLSAAFDWRFGAHTALELDGDWQKKSQLSVPGYQALGGSALPAGVSPETMLNNQPWSEPVAVEAHDLGARFSHGDADDWRFTAAVNRNRVAAEDKAAFPYGCSSGPVYLAAFCGDGGYDLYDYRSSGEVRDVLHARADLRTRRRWAGMEHALAFGLSRFTRAVDLGSEVFDYVGAANIYDAAPRLFGPSSRGTGDVHRVQDYDELAATAEDAVALADRWTALAGARLSAVADDRFSKADGSPAARFRRTFLLPRLGLTFAPSPGMALYGAYSQGLELGGAAPVTAANAGEILDPKIARQVEAGIKREIDRRLLATAAAFYLWKPYEFTGPDNVFRREGAVRHAGFELSAAGKAAAGLRVFASGTFIDARLIGTGVGAYDERVPVNVPRWRGQASADWLLPWIQGAALSGTWTGVSRKHAARDNSLAVPAYQRVDAGLRYETPLGGSLATWRFRVENLLDAVYWKDVGEYLGDGYLHLGVPRVFTLSVQLDF